MLIKKLFLITDMGWPTKGSGKSYNSHTGFGSFIGAYSQKKL